MKDMVSVIITAYNSNDFLIEALDSVEKQSYPSLEVVVVDDGSREDRATFIAQAVARYPRARLVRQENQGPSAARNRGATESSGRYLAFLDHDDAWEPQFLERLAFKLASDDSLGAAFCRIQHVTASGEPTGRTSKAKLSGFSIRDFLISDPLCCGSCFIIRRDTFEDVGGFSTDFHRAEQPEYFIRFLEAGWRLEGLDQALVRYRNTPGSLSAGQTFLRDRKRLLQQTFRRHPDLASSIPLRVAMLSNQLRIQLRRFLLR
jgi:glycosyltransferase involved in cell wall biosynthesis